MASGLDMAPGLLQSGSEVDVASGAADLWWASLRLGLSKFEFGEFGTDLNVFDFEEEFNAFMQSTEATNPAVAWLQVVEATPFLETPGFEDLMRAIAQDMPLEGPLSYALSQLLQQHGLELHRIPGLNRAPSPFG